MDALELFKRWQRASGVFPIGETRRRLIQEWDQILYLESGELERAVRTAIAGDRFSARQVEIIALNLRIAKDRKITNRRHGARKIRRPPTFHPR